MMPVACTDKETTHAAIVEKVEAGSMLNTDETGAYDGIKARSYQHETVNHSASEFVRGNVTTNGIESVFAVLQRGIIGVYHHTSDKHLARYVDEFA